MRILVNPDQLRALSAQFRQSAEELQTIEGRMGNALERLSWEARQKAGVEGQLAHARSQARSLAGRADEMSYYLVAKAQAFEEADRQGSSDVRQISAFFNQRLEDTNRRWGFPAQRADALRNLGSLFGQSSSIKMLHLPMTGGGTVAIGLTSLRPWFNTLSAVRDFGERVWNWLGGKGWKTDEEIRAEKEEERKHKEEEQQKDGVTFGDLLRAEEQGRQRARDWWNNNGLNQLESKVAKVAGQYGAKYNACGPVILTMLINYYDFSQEANSVPLAPEELVYEAGEAGFFLGDGMASFSELDSLARKHGYELHPELDKDGYVIISAYELIKQIRLGKPVGVLMKFTYKDGKYVPDKDTKFDHFVIVSELSPDEKMVTIINPHPGLDQTKNSDIVPQQMTIEDFKSCWEYDATQHLGQGFILQPKHDSP